jgi:Domain of unknown function (DUF4280)
MPKHLVVHGATLKCNQGSSTSSYTVMPGIADAKDKSVATVMDFVPMGNIAPFGMCKTQSNPQVAAATAAAQGVLTPQPCIPVVTSPWSPGSSVSTIDGKKALTDDSKCNCQWSGEISITDAGTDVETD